MRKLAEVQKLRRRLHRALQTGQTKRLQRRQLKLRQQQSLSILPHKNLILGRSYRHVAVDVPRMVGKKRLIQQRLGHNALFGVNRRQFITNASQRRTAACLGRKKLTGRNIRISQTVTVTLGENRRQIAGRIFLQQVIVDHRAGRDNPGHRTLYDTFGQLGVLHLVTNGHLKALLYQLGKVNVRRVIRHAAHRQRPLTFTAGGQRNIQGPRTNNGIVTKHLIEIAHAVKQQAILILLLDLLILYLHRRQARFFLFRFIYSHNTPQNNLFT